MNRNSIAMALIELPEIGCSFHTYSKVLICKTCRYGLYTGPRNTTPYNHFRYSHQADAVFRASLKNVFQTLGTSHYNQLRNPPPFGPPIPDLDVYYAWYCRRPIKISGMLESTMDESICQYLSRSTDHFLRHQNEVHNNNDERDFVCQKVLVQSFFRNRYQQWFPVAHLPLFDHRQLHTQQPAWRIPIEKTIENVGRDKGPASANTAVSPVRSDSTASIEFIEGDMLVEEDQ